MLSVSSKSNVVTYVFTYYYYYYYYYYYRSLDESDNLRNTLQNHVKVLHSSHL